MLRNVLATFCLALAVGVSDAEAARRALLVGVDSYQNLPYDSPRLGRRMVNLKGAVNDVKGFADALVTQFAFRSDEIRMLTNEQATRENLLAVFQDWLIRGTREGDVVVFMFSGHGTQVPDENGDEDDGLDEALAPYDLVPSATRVNQARLILDDDIARLLGELRGRSVAFIVDACHSGTMTRSIGGEVVRQLEATPAQGSSKFIWLDNLFSTRGADRVVKPSSPTWEQMGDNVVMTSSSPSQLSIEVMTPNRTFHGAFSAALIEAMRRLPGPSYRDLYTYARRVMRDQFRVPQDPEIESAQTRLLDLPAFDSVRTPATPVSKRESTPSTTRPPVPPSAAKPSAANQTRPPTIATVPSSRPAPASSRAPLPDDDGRLRLRIGTIEGAAAATLSALRQRLGSLSYVQLVDGDVFDRLLRGRLGGGVYELRLLNPMGDATVLGPATSAANVLERAAPHLEYAYVFKQLTSLRPNRASFKVDISVRDDRRDFRVGERLVFDIRSERDAFVLLFNLDSAGSLHLVFPNQFSQENFVAAGTAVALPTDAMRKGRFEFEFMGPAGEETFKLIATNQPLDRGVFTSLPGVADVASGRPLARSSPSRDLVTELSAMIAEKGSAPGFLWSEETIVLRSYSR